MAENLAKLQLHWARPATVADADQEVGIILGLLKFLRANQWIVLYRAKNQTITGYFPFRKQELSDRLIGSEQSRMASDVLDLPEEGMLPLARKVSSFPVDDLKDFSTLRPVWLGEDGQILGIGVPRSLRISAALELAREFTVLAAEADFDEPDNRYLNTGIVLSDEETGQVLDFSDPGTFTNFHRIVSSDSGQKTDFPVVNPQSENNDTLVKVFFGTDRQKRVDSKNQLQFLGQRSSNETISVGICSVSLPPNHRIGHLERPAWWSLWKQPKPGIHVALISTLEYQARNFYEVLGNAITKSKKKQAFIFIHGYNVSFEDAVLRTAQLAFDLQFDGAPILFSWPSKGKAANYLADEGSIQWSRPHLESFIHRVRNDTGAESIHLIAHSMGNRALIEVLRSLDQLNFQQLVLAAPDVDSGVFKQLVTKLTQTVQRITLYASSKAKALSASKTIHGFTRAGEAGANLVIIPGVDTIDATEVDTDFLGHSFIVQERALVNDLFALFAHGDPPSARFGLLPRVHTSGQYWGFRP